MRAPTNTDEDEYTRWKRCEPVAEKDSPNALNPKRSWMGLREQYTNLGRLALDVLSIPASSCACECMFSELGDLPEPRRRNIPPQLLAAIQCVRRWRRAGFSDDKAAEKSTITDREMELLHGISTWDDELDTMLTEAGLGRSTFPEGLKTPTS
jgi:hypothetical protein